MLKAFGRLAFWVIVLLLVAAVVAALAGRPTELPDSPVTEPGAGATASDRSGGGYGRPLNHGHRRPGELHFLLVRRGGSGTFLRSPALALRPTPRQTLAHGHT